MGRSKADFRKPRIEPDDDAVMAQPRIIGGTLGGRKLVYSGDIRTRPMKERVREAVFNLIGTDVRGTHAVDLFAGTGALGLEALSRGAARATFIEQHFPTAALIEQNIAALDLTGKCEVKAANTFIWAKRTPELGPEPWLVFSSPPYAFYVDRQAEMLELIGELYRRAPEASVLLVEADQQFDFTLLPDADQWDVRQYPPAHVGIMKKGKKERKLRRLNSEDEAFDESERDD
jgi:16S rRNA (guanine966-N2)-methyltransferase